MQRFKNILCVVNPQEKASAVMQRAVDMAAKQKTSLTLARVDAATPSTVANDDRQFDDDQRSEIQAKNHPQIEKNGFEGKLDIMLLRGIPFEEIIRQVQRGKHDLLIKPVEVSGNGRTQLQITDKRLLRECPCPVWLVKPTAHNKPDRILGALDSHPGKSTAKLNDLILDLSTLVAAEEDAELHAVSSWRVPGEIAMRSRIGTTAIRRLLASVRRTNMQWLRRLTKPYGKNGVIFFVYFTKGKSFDAILAEA